MKVSLSDPETIQFLHSSSSQLFQMSEIVENDLLVCLALLSSVQAFVSDSSAMSKLQSNDVDSWAI
jgi:hypothetical protein